MTVPAPVPLPEPDIEDLVCAYLQPLAPGQVSARAPASPFPLPFVVVQRVAGGNDYIWDYATVAIDFLAASQTAASTLAFQGHHMMRQLRPQTVIDVNGTPKVISHIEYEQAPMWLDYDDPIVMRYVARYVITQRLPAIPGF